MNRHLRVISLTAKLKTISTEIGALGAQEKKADEDMLSHLTSAQDQVEAAIESLNDFRWMKKMRK